MFCFVLFYTMFVFLFSLWHYELCLVSILYYSHHIMFICWTCIHPYAFCSFDCMSGWSFVLLSDHCSHFHMTVWCLIKLLICFTSCLLDHIFICYIMFVLLLLTLPWGSNMFCASVLGYKYFVPSSSQVLDLGVSEFCHCSQTHV